MVRQLLLVIGLAGMLVLGGAVLAQDAPTPTAPVEGEVPAEGVVPAEGEVIEGPTLESVTADPGAVYGQEVTLEGVLAEFVNVRTFVLSEGAALDDDKVLVINNTPIEFDPTLVTGERVRITGVVMPSYNEGGFEQVITNFMDIIAPAQAPVDTTTGDTGTADAQATPADAAAGDTGAADATPADATTTDMTPADDAATDATPADATTGDTSAVDATPADATSADATPADETAADATPAEGAMDEATDTEPTPDQAAPVDATPAEGGEPVEATPAPVEATPMTLDTSVQTPGFDPASFDFTPLTNAIAERFPDFTIVEITSIDTVMFVPPTE